MTDVCQNPDPAPQHEPRSGRLWSVLTCQRWFTGFNKRLTQMEGADGGRRGTCTEIL